RYRHLAIDLSDRRANGRHERVRFAVRAHDPPRYRAMTEEAVGQGHRLSAIRGERLVALAVHPANDLEPFRVVRSNTHVEPLAYRRLTRDGLRGEVTVDDRQHRV